MTIGIVIIATNSYFILGLRFIKRFMHFYKGNQNIKFYFFSDNDPAPYLPEEFPLKYISQNHDVWQDGTNSKFKNILLLENEPLDYIYYFDADTNVYANFDENWFIGDLVGGEHYANKSWMIDKKGFDRNPLSKAYVALDTQLPQMYYYGAFFGGQKTNIIKFCNLLRSWQIEDSKIPYEPAVNDESYINAYFHYNPPTRIVACPEFPFGVSDKAGIGETRNAKLDITNLKSDFLKNKHINNINIYNNEVVVYE